MSSLGSCVYCGFTQKRIRKAESDLWWRDNEHLVVGGTAGLRERDAGHTWSLEGREMGAGLTLCHTLCLASYMHLFTCGRKDIR